jgi:hypothetical protein
MFSDRAIRLSTFVWALLFGLVVILGYIPSLNTQKAGVVLEPGEHMLMGLYAISLIDDVTHGVTALVMLAAAAASARYARLSLIAFGWYYACDAVFYLVHGVLVHQAPMANVLLNLPHVVISSLLLAMAYRGRVDVPRSSVATAD